MFQYAGAKWRLAPFYPPPKHKLIVEPFAGAAGYSLRWFDRNVLLTDVNEKIVGIWEFLIRSSPSDILNLPCGFKENVSDLKICQEARWLIGFWMFGGSPSPREKILATRKPDNTWCPVKRHRVAKQVDQIKHWKVRLCSWEKLENVEATWFVDPPYQEAGKMYDHHDVDFPRLGAWCKERKGQAIVCENQGADWLPFQPFRLNTGKVSSRDGMPTTKMEMTWIKD